jgi:hypothetical protein
MGGGGGGGTRHVFPIWFLLTNITARLERLASDKRSCLTLPWFDSTDASSTSLFFFRLRDHFPRRVRRLVAVRRDAAPSRHPRPQHDVLQPQRRVVLHLAGQEVRLPFARFAQSEFRRQDQRSGRTSDPLSEFKGLNPAATRAYLFSWL